MAKNFKDLIARMSPERQARVKEKVEQILFQMGLVKIQKIKTRTNGVVKTLKKNKNN